MGDIVQLGDDVTLYRGDCMEFMLCNDDGARQAVLCMLARWQGCALTAQELHDAAGVRPLPPMRDDHGKRAPAELEEVECARCGDTYQRPVDSDARWAMCRRCTSTVRQRAARLAREYVAWCRTQPAVVSYSPSLPKKLIENCV